MTDLPLLKYACDIEPGEESVGLTYRGRSYHLPLEGFRPELLRLFDGRRTITQIARSSGASHAIVESVVDRLSEIPLVVDGRDVLRDDGCLSGSELFWRLERLLYRWRYDGPRAVACDDLEREIATGSAPESVVRGYCIEIAHQLRNTPTEIAVAIASSPTVAVRRLFIRFWDEEYDHGDKLMDVLAGWMPRRRR